MLNNNLPSSFKGFSTHFSAPDEKGVKVSKQACGKKIRHAIEIVTIESFFKKNLHFDVTQNLSAYDWLVLPEQKLLSITSGKIFHDDLNLKKAISKFSYFPKDVWLYLLAAQWTRISQEEHLTGRCGEVNDELGSKIIATRVNYLPLKRQASGLF